MKRRSRGPPIVASEASGYCPRVPRQAGQVLCVLQYGHNVPFEASGAIQFEKRSYRCRYHLLRHKLRFELARSLSESISVLE